MSELGKMEEGRDHDMNLYPMSCKAEMRLDSDKLPQELRECTPASQDGSSKNGPEIKSSVDEAGRVAVVTQLIPIIGRHQLADGNVHNNVFTLNLLVNKKKIRYRLFF